MKRVYAILISLLFSTAAVCGPFANSGSGSSSGVTSVGATGSNGITVTGSPVTAGGTLTFSLPSVSTGTVTATSLTATSINGTLTSVTGTLTGSITGNSATVTTIPNLTGPITSSGNTTALAAQTGTGSTFVVQTSPTVNTPTFGGLSTFSNAGSIKVDTSASGSYSLSTATASLRFLNSALNAWIKITAGSVGISDTGNLNFGTFGGETTNTAIALNATGQLEIDNGSACSTASNCRDLILRHETVVGLRATNAAAPTISSATTIAPTTSIAFVSGTTAVVTITPPSPISSGGGQITLIPTGLWSTTTGGNIALATTAVVNKALILTYDTTTTKWYPSY